MSDAIEQSSFCFEFQVTKAEDRFFRALAVKNLKLLGDQRIITGVPVLAYALILVWGYAAADRGWLTQNAAFAPPLWFLLGYFFAYFVAFWSMRKLHDRLFELRVEAQNTWHVSLDDLSIIVRTSNVESRMSWDAITAVKDSQAMVAIWYDARLGFFIPARVLADPPSRAAFAAWASERVRRAADSSSAPQS